MIRRGVCFMGGQAVEAMVEGAMKAEAAGMDSIWVAEGHLGRDALVALGAIAARTEAIALGTGVVNPFTRHPAQLAAAFATLDEVSGRRAMCGVGTGTRDQLAKLGYDGSKPLATTKEMIGSLRTLLARETLALDGTKFNVSSARLAFRPVRTEIPIYLGATGPKMCALAGEVADGIYLMYGSPGYIERAIEHTTERRVDGRSFDIACQAVCGIDDDRERARAQVRTTIGLMLTPPTAEAVLDANGLDPAKANRIRTALAGGGIGAVADAVDEQVLDVMTITGTPDECRLKVQALVDLGVSHPTLAVVGNEVEAALRVLLAIE